MELRYEHQPLFYKIQNNTKYMDVFIKKKLRISHLELACFTGTKLHHFSNLFRSTVSKQEGLAHVRVN